MDEDGVVENDDAINVYDGEIRARTFKVDQADDVVMHLETETRDGYSVILETAKVMWINGADMRMGGDIRARKAGAGGWTWTPNGAREGVRVGGGSDRKLKRNRGKHLTD